MYRQVYTMYSSCSNKYVQKKRISSWYTMYIHVHDVFPFIVMYIVPVLNLFMLCIYQAHT
jgi:hypothetical protein